ncbi:YciI family protein [Ketobacter sp.]|uniref:YciI family protein n=1 Tax=Ketobacter sp. TaxID=2083498 RepID=UPI000F0DC670|nr:YciI family protein [Ketobacter sp.]RLT96747.1 MAG: hypothetical protein D9N14_11950 [Ketobacter sp.]
MFIVLLKFSAHKAKAPELMADHNAWLQQGFDDGVFLLAGSLQPQLGGSILAHNTQREALLQRVEEDPFVAHGVVSAEILEISPGRTDPRLAFLQAEAAA